MSPAAADVVWHQLGRWPRDFPERRERWACEASPVEVYSFKSRRKFVLRQQDRPVGEPQADHAAARIDVQHKQKGPAWSSNIGFDEPVVAAWAH